MADSEPAGLSGRYVLVVEDEYLVATDLASVLEEFGVNVIGPASSVEEALELVEAHGEKLDGAVLDVNLREVRVYPVAQALAERGVPYVFTTGYEASAIPEPHASAPRYEKPVDQTVLIGWLS